MRSLVNFIDRKKGAKDYMENTIENWLCLNWKEDPFLLSFFWHSFRISFARNQLFIYELLYIRCDVLFILHRWEILSQCKDTNLHICCLGGRKGIGEGRGWIPDIHQDTTDQFFWHSQAVKRLLLLMIFSILDLIWFTS